MSPNSTSRAVRGRMHGRAEADARLPQRTARHARLELAHPDGLTSCRGTLDRRTPSRSATGLLFATVRRMRMTTSLLSPKAERRAARPAECARHRLARTKPIDEQLGVHARGLHGCGLSLQRHEP
jgi:hypothetical protein